MGKTQPNFSNILFSKVRQRVLGLLFCQPNRSFHTNEIIRLTRSGTGAVQRELEKLSGAGSIAKQEDTAHSDIDLMLISDNLTYADLFKLLENAQTALSRSIHPTFYSASEWKQKIKAGNHFLDQVMIQPKIFLIGTQNELLQFR